MKKFKSFLAILLLGGLVATGCGSKDKTPSDSGGSQQNINSGSGDNGGSSQGGGSQQGGEGGGQQGGGGGQTVTTSWPSTTVQVYLDTLGVEHDRVPSIENDAITNYIVSPDITTAQTEKGFSVVCMGGGSLINSYIDTLVANGYSYDISSNAYKTPLGEILIALDSAEGNLVIIIALPDAGGGGGGGATIPDNSRFLNTKITTQTVSTANPQNAQVEAAYANSYIAFFSDGTCELVATYNGIINALFGTYGVNQADNLATIHVYKMYDGEDQFYSWSVDTDLETLSVHYIQSDDNFVLSFSMNYPYTTVNLTLGNPTSDPVRATLPTDPNGTGTTFNNQYQVEIDEWDSWFKEDTPNLQRNFTVTATVPDAFGTGTDTYTIEVDGRRIHKTVDGDPTAEEYYFIDETWYDNSIFEGYYVNTYYKSGNDWVENTHQGIVYDALYSYKCGLHSVNFMDVLYNENQHQYYSSRATYFDSHGYSDELNRYTVKFENTLTKCVLKQVYYQKTYQGLEYTYDFSKVGSTSVSLPNSGGGGDPTPAEWPTSTVQAYLAKIGATQDTLPAASSPNITGYSFYPG
ncbi:MAG: hypothetical protein IKP50_04730, partial [Bacilli bacterium]|nr:hypothetical protein [Bacilli bacterium]